MNRSMERNFQGFHMTRDNNLHSTLCFAEAKGLRNFFGKIVFQIWLLWLIAPILGGCAGYRLGPSNGNVAGAKSIQINPFRNETSEPRLIEPVVLALRKQLQQDGTFRIATHGDADIIVGGIITRYERQGISFRPDDILTARDFNVRLVAKITATDRNTGKTVLEREVAGRTSLRPGADFASAERQAVPLLAADLARIVTSLLVDGDW